MVGRLVEWVIPGTGVPGPCHACMNPAVFTVRQKEILAVNADRSQSPAPQTYPPAVPAAAAWLIAGALVVIATMLVLRQDSNPGNLAWAQPSSGAGARGVFAFSGQLSKTSYGVYLVDVDAMTMWVYEYLPQKGCLRLAAARTWRYDRYLEDYNLCDMPPDAVERMIEEQRQYKLQASESNTP